MANLRKKILVAGTIAMFAIAGFLTYTKNGTHPILSTPEPTGEPYQPSLQETQQVLGQEKKYSSEQQEIVLHLDITPENILWFTNYYRKQSGLAPLVSSVFLEESSTAKNADMLHYEYFEHSRPEKYPAAGFDFFIDGTGYRFIKIAENLAQGDFATSKEIVDAWMNSPSHRKNILDPLFTEIGIAVATTSVYPGPAVLVTQHFGRPAQKCPEIPAGDKEHIEKKEKELSLLREEMSGLLEQIQQDTLSDDDIEKVIATYNAKIATYNILVQETKNLVDTYNNQVTVIKQCMKR